MDGRDFGGYIREARKNRGLTQEELAERLGTSPTTVSNWEREEVGPDREQVNAIVVALGLSPEVLLSRMGYRLTPPAASRLPRELLRLLLEMSPAQHQALLEILTPTMARERVR